MVAEVEASPKLISYLLDLVEATRTRPDLIGLSPRSSLGLLGGAKAWAFVHGRDYVLPEDIQEVAIPVMNHRILAADEMSAEAGIEAAKSLITSVDPS